MHPIDDRSGPSRRQVLLAVATLIPASLIAVLLPDLRTGPTVTCTVDLTTISQATDPTCAGVALSTFGRLPTDPQQGQAEKTLDTRYFRIPVRWDGSAIVSSANGGNNLPLEASLQTYYSWPGVRMLLVVAGRDSDWHGYQNGDAGNIARRLQTLGMTDMSRFDFSGANEPDRNGASSMTEVADRCAQIADELRAAGAVGTVWGPVWSAPLGDFATFAKQLGAHRLGGIDWHYYPDGAGLNGRSVQQVLSAVADHGRVVSAVRTMLKENGLPANTNIDELNWSWQMGNAPPLFTAANTVMMALGFCTILSTGGRCMAYATQNGELSVMADSYGNPAARPQSSPMPAYWGIATLTGANMPGQPPLFPHYKDTFYSSTSDDATVKVFAVNNEGGGVNLIAINTNENTDRSVTLSISGMSTGSYDVFQTRREQPYDPPQKILAAATFSSTLSVKSPALTVSVIVLKPHRG